MRPLFALILLLFSASFSCFAQLRVSEGELMLLSRHVWRGEQMGTSVSIEPSVTVAKGPFSFNVWAALTPNNSYSELDLIPSWQFSHFQLSLLDYFNPIVDEPNNFWSVKNGVSRHSVELTLDNYTIEKQRLKWMAGTFLLGDKDEDTGKPLWSSYIEFSYPFSFLGLEAEPFAGFTPFQSFYADHFSFVNTGLNLGKELELTKTFSIPLSLSLIHNPYTQNSFAIFAAGLAF